MSVQMKQYLLASRYMAQSEALFDQAYELVSMDRLSNAREASLIVADSITKLSLASHIYENILQDGDSFFELFHTKMRMLLRLQGVIMYNLELAQQDHEESNMFAQVQI